jgi:hypothetical protein
MADTWNLFCSQVAFAASKPMCYIKNADATLVVKIRRIRVRNNQTGAVTGVVCQLELRKYNTSFTPGTNVPVTPTKLDSSIAGAMDADITMGNATSISAGTLEGTLDRMFWSSDEPSISTATNDELQVLSGLTTLYEWIPHSDVQPLTLRQNETMVVFNTTGAAGLLDTIVEFTVE